MSDSKFSILLMRDNTDVKRFSISPTWLKMFVVAQGVLVLFAVGGIYLGISSWWGSRALQSEKKALEQRLVEAEVKLERLGNMEKILRSYDPKELQSLMGSSPVESDSVRQPVSPPDQAPAAQAAPAPAPAAGGLDLARLFSRLSTRQIAVGNLQATAQGSQVTVSFDLTNVQGAAPLSGQADVLFIRNDGAVVPVQVNKNDLSFQIQRLKRIKTTFSLPGQLTAKDIFALRLEIKSEEGKIVFTETYPLNRILG